MQLRDDLLNPIDDENPGGSSLRYEPIYDEIKEARRQDEGLPQGKWETDRKKADWAAVVKLAGDALASRSKDLWLAAWLTEALLWREGFDGLRQGLDLLGSLVERFWDHLYPQLEEGDPELRAAPLGWVGQYLDVAVKSVPLTQYGHTYLDYTQARALGYEKDIEGDSAKQAEREQAVAEGKLTPEEFDRGFTDTPKAWYKELVADLDSCLDALAALEKIGDEKFGDLAPSYRVLRGALKEVRDVAGGLLHKKLELEPDPEPTPQPSPAGASRASPAATSTGAVSLDPADVRDADARLAAVARFLRRRDPRNPASYLMLRGLRWGELRANGGPVDPRLLAAPPTETRTRLKTLLLDGEWSRLLDECEDVMATRFGRGWLDLQRYVLTACYKLGSEYDIVAASILDLLSLLLRDFPNLPELTLMDDTPTANEETRNWLREGVLEGEALPRPPAQHRVAEGEDGSPSDGRQGPDRRAYERAMAEVRDGRPEKGIEILMRELEREKSERSRFLRRSDMAGIMVDSGFEEVAMPILKELLQQIEDHGLETWEAGEVVARPLGLLYRCMDELGGESPDAQKNLYLRICRLDPLQAIAYTGRTPERDSPEAMPTSPERSPELTEEPTPPEEDEQAGT